MGCDIHTWVEVQNKQRDWELVTDAIFPCPDYDPNRPTVHHPASPEELAADPSAEGWWENPVQTSSPYQFRNYDFFSLLAGVRSDGTWQSLAEPRGIPDDASPGYLRYCHDYGPDRHTHSYYSLQELLDVDWDDGVALTGYVSFASFKHFHEHGSPNWWSDCTGPGEVAVPIEQFHRRLRLPEGEQLPAGRGDRALLTWQRTRRQIAGNHFFKSLEIMKTLGPPAKVRLVFCFDN